MDTNMNMAIRSIKGIKEMFPDWEEMKPGSWSKNGKVIDCGDNGECTIEIGLYREPLNGVEYQGTYTLQIFNGDDVVLSEMVYGLEAPVEYKFVWNMTEQQWARMMLNHLLHINDSNDFFGKVCVGNLSIEFQHTMDNSDWYMFTNVFCYGLDEGYADYKGTPYAYLDCEIEIPNENSFEKFKKKCEERIERMIKNHNLRKEASVPTAPWAFN